MERMKCWLYRSSSSRPMPMPPPTPYGCRPPSSSTSSLLCLILASSWFDDSVRLDVSWSGSESDSSLSGSVLRECRRRPFEEFYVKKKTNETNKNPSMYQNPTPNSILNLNPRAHRRYFFLLFKLLYTARAKKRTKNWKKVSVEKTQKWFCNFGSELKRL